MNPKTGVLACSFNCDMEKTSDFFLKELQNNKHRRFDCVLLLGKHRQRVNKIIIMKKLLFCSFFQPNQVRVKRFKMWLIIVCSLIVVVVVVVVVGGVFFFIQ